MMQHEVWSLAPMNKGASVTNKAPSPQTAQSSADKATMIGVLRIFMTKNITVHFITAENRIKIFVTLYVIMLKVSVRILFALDVIIADTLFRCCLLLPLVIGDKVKFKFLQSLFSSVHHHIIHTHSFKSHSNPEFTWHTLLSNIETSNLQVI